MLQRDHHVKCLRREYIKKIQYAFCLSYLETKKNENVDYYDYVDYVDYVEYLFLLFASIKTHCLYIFETQLLRLYYIRVILISYRIYFAILSKMLMISMILYSNRILFSQ
jgi:hypothetical protein